MRIGRSQFVHAALAACLLASAAGAARAIEVQNLEGLEDIFGRYAPGGDCAREPRITVERSGLTFEGAGPTEKVTNPEYAASYGGNFYEGISKWIFPFRSGGGYPILMSFNADEKKGALTITPHDEGFQGGPKLSPRNQKLVSGSPYALCR
jgi:hypothetical protein